LSHACDLVRIVAQMSLYVPQLWLTLKLTEYDSLRINRK
jgi:hypothetical protein